jgi:Outer membrane protein beta-barrel domain
MYYLLRKQTRVIFALLFLWMLCINANAQMQINRPERDDVAYYFGITLGYNTSMLRSTKSTNFLLNDSVKVAEAGTTGGITVGLSATGRLTDHLQIRATPQLILGGARTFNYTLGLPALGESIEQVKQLPTTLVSLPIHLKFQSDRINNFRFYVLGGVRFDRDLSSNSGARNAEDLIKLKPSDFGLETGLGFNFYLPFVTISPEIKFTYGVSNIHNRDPNLKYSSVFDKIQSRMVSFSLHFEN